MPIDYSNYYNNFLLAFTYLFITIVTNFAILDRQALATLAAS